MKFSRYTTIRPLKEDAYLMINALSGAIDIIDQKNKQEIEQIIETGCTDRIEKELLDNLQDRGYLYNNEEEEEAFIQKVFQLYQKVIDKGAAKIVICPTFLCNLRCVYCFESLEMRSGTDIIPPEEIDNIFRYIDKILEIKNLKSYEIELFGGEPLLPSTYETNKRIFELARQRKKCVSIITNGTHIGFYLNLLREYKDCVDNLQITIDGIKEIHDMRRVKTDQSGTFDLICEGITQLLQVGIKVGVRINLDRQNIDTLKELVCFFEEQGWSKSKYFHADVAPVVDHTCANLSNDIMKENKIMRRIKELFPQKIEDSYFKLRLFRVLNHLNQVLGDQQDSIAIPSFHYCEGNRMEFFVFAPDGYIYLCPEAVGAKEAVIGEYKNGFQLYDSISQWEERSILTIPKCRECEIAPFCGGGCPYASIAVKGDINNPVCDESKEVLYEYIETIKDEILENYSE